MKAYETTRQLLRTYSQRAGKADIELNHQGAAVVSVDTEVQITLYLGAQADSVLFLADITSLTSTTQDDQLLRALLSHSFPGYRTRGGALLINEASGSLVFSYEHKLAELDPPTLENLIGNLSQTIQYFRQQASAFRLGQKLS